MFLESVVQDKTAPMKILCQPVKKCYKSHKNHDLIHAWMNKEKGAQIRMMKKF